MIIKKNSTFCLCAELEIEAFRKFNSSVIEKLQEIYPSYTFNTNSKEELDIVYSNYLHPFECFIDIKSSSKEQAIIEFNKIIDSIETKYKLVENKEEKEKEIELAKQKLENKTKYFEKPKSRLKMHLTLKQDVDHLIITQILNNAPETALFKMVEKKNPDQVFKVSLCSYINLDKKLDLMHGYEFNRRLTFPKKISEQIGEAYITSINLTLLNSPLGIQELEIGEDEDYKKFNINMEFSDKNLSDLKEIIRTLFNIINLFILED